MKTTKIFVTNKTTAITIALVLVLTFSAILVALPSANAHTPALNITAVYCFTVVTPNIIGVGQTANIVFWSNQIPPTAVGSSGDRWSFTVDVTKPDGSKETIGPLTSDPVGTGYTFFTPTQVGTYTFTTTVAEHTITGDDPNGYAPNWGPRSSGYASVGDVYATATSKPTTLVVQEDPIQSWPAAALPTDYWSRPINAQNREWWTISGDWYESRGYNAAAAGYYYKGGGYNPYTTGPASAHIVWAKPMPTFGGLVGGTVSENGGVGNYYTGMSYEQMWGTGSGPFILNGRLYYNTPQFAQPNYGVYSVDLRTGQQYWYQNYTVTNGQAYNYISPNQYGGIPYLWSLGRGTYDMYDAVTGNWILSFVDTQSGTVAYSPTDGSLLVYIMGGTGANRWLAMWNSSLAVWANMPNLWSGNNYWLWRPPVGSTNLNWSLGVQWNVTEPAVAGVQSIKKVDTDDSNVVLCQAAFTQNDGTIILEDMAYSAVDGSPLWGPVNRTALASGTTYGGFLNTFVLTGISNGIYVEYDGTTMSFTGYSATNGTHLWGPVPAGPTVSGWAAYGAYRCSWVGQGHVYLNGMDGYIHCLDIYTGKWLWDFSTESSGLETNWGKWPLLTATFLGGAPGTGGLRIYSVGGHTHLQPLYRGARMYCVNGSNGALLWSISGWFEAGAPAGADGYMAAINGYDNQLYCFGKGNTQTTVDAPMTGVTLGNNVVIRGTVTDQSPGQTCLGIPAAGTPAIADESMSEWMEYLYMQQPCPEDAEGVEVVLTTFDPNGNTYEIGRTTSSDRGTFGCEVDLPVTGLYKIIATFEGSESYYRSYAETYINVGEAPSAAQPIEPEPTTPEPTEPEPTEPEPTEPEPTEPTEAPLFSTTDLAIIAAVAVAVVIGITAYWKLRKRK